MKLIQAIQYWRNIIKNINKYPAKYKRHLYGDLNPLITFHNIDTQLLENILEEMLMNTNIFIPAEIDTIIDSLFCYGDYCDLIPSLLNTEINNQIVKTVIQSWNDAIYNMDNIEDRYKDKLNYIILKQLVKIKIKINIE